MIILYSKLIYGAILDFDEKNRLGQAGEFVFDPTGFKISAILVRNSFLPFYLRTRAISNLDIISIDSEAIYIKDKDAIIPLSDLPNVQTLIKQGCVGIGQKVKSRSKGNIGAVYDISFDSGTLNIVNFYVKSTFSERIIPAESVIEWNNKALVIKDEFENIKIPVFSPEPARAK